MFLVLLLLMAPQLQAQFGIIHLFQKNEPSPNEPDASNLRNRRPSSDPRDNIFVQEVYLREINQFGRIRYHNFNFLPVEFYLSWGFGTYVPVVRSGDYFSLGPDAEISLGPSLRLEDVTIFSAPVYASARIGRGNQASCEHRFGLGAGVGPEFYYNHSSEEGFKEQAFRPSTFVEVVGKIWFTTLSVRYSKMVTIGDMTKESVAVGLLVLID